MRLTRLYTRTGDDGTTRLADGRELAKDSARVTAYGTVDELNAVLGVVLATGVVPRLAGEIRRLQNELLDLGGDLSTPRDREVPFEVPRVDTEQVTRLEGLIDELTGAVAPLENFVLPGGAAGAAALHVARTVSRRAERDAVALSRSEEIGPAVLPYLNRLSDLLFAMARYENQERGVEEPLWEPGA